MPQMPQGLERQELKQQEPELPKPQELLMLKERPMLKERQERPQA